jgi:hypothetical protein
MRSVIRRAGPGACLVSILLLWLVWSPPWALGQSVSPSARGPSVTSGEVTGSLVQGGTLTIRVEALMPGGWRGLHLVEASVLVGGSVIEHMVFDIEDDKLSIGDQNIAVGTGAVAEGEYLRVNGTDVVAPRRGANLSFRVEAQVVKTITGEPRFRLSVTDDFGTSDAWTVQLAGSEGSGITWGTVATFVLAALFAGVFFGNLFASKRRPPPRASVYEAVQMRLERERAAKEGPR